MSKKIVNLKHNVTIDGKPMFQIIMAEGGKCNLYSFGKLDRVFKTNTEAMAFFVDIAVKGFTIEPITSRVSL